MMYDDPSSFAGTGGKSSHELDRKRECHSHIHQQRGATRSSQFPRVSHPPQCRFQAGNLLYLPGVPCDLPTSLSLHHTFFLRRRKQQGFLITERNGELDLSLSARTTGCSAASHGPTLVQGPEQTQKETWKDSGFPVLPCASDSLATSHCAASRTPPPRHPSHTLALSSPPSLLDHLHVLKGFFFAHPHTTNSETKHHTGFSKKERQPLPPPALTGIHKPNATTGTLTTEKFEAFSAKRRKS